MSCIKDIETYSGDAAVVGVLHGALAGSGGVVTLRLKAQVANLSKRTENRWSNVRNEKFNRDFQMVRGAAWTHDQGLLLNVT